MSLPESHRSRFALATAAEDLARPDATVTDSHGRGVHVKFDNGWTVSIQWGSGTYSDNRHDFSPESWREPATDSHTAEIAARKDDGDMIRWPDGDTVQGWQSWDDVQRVLDAASADTLETAS